LVFSGFFLVRAEADENFIVFRTVLASNFYFRAKRWFRPVQPDFGFNWLGG